MKRRSTICLLGAMLVWPSAAFAQVSDRRPLVAVLVGGSSTNVSVRKVQNGFVQAMQEHGYVEGRDIDIVYRFAAGDLKRMPELANELIRLVPAVFVTATIASTLAIKQATATIPIVNLALNRAQANSGARGCRAVADPIWHS